MAEAKKCLEQQRYYSTLKTFYCTQYLTSQKSITNCDH